MVETLTESFCERCGTRYEFKAPTRLNPLRKTRGFIGGLKNYLTSQDDLSDAMGDAMRSEEDQLAAAQLEAFHESFNFCIGCRQYTCLNCWNDGEGRCRTCAPVAGTDDLAERLAASFAAGSPTTAEAPSMDAGDLERRLGGLGAWPSADLTEAPPATNGHTAPAWPTADDLPWPTAEEPEPVLAEELEPDPVIAEEPEPIAAEIEPEPEPFVAEEPEPVVADEPEPFVAEEAEPEPVVAEELEPEPEPVAAEDEHPALRVVAWEDDAAYELGPVIVEPEPVLAEVEFEPDPVVAAVEPEPVLAAVEPEPEPVVAAVEPEPVLAAVEPEPEPVVAAVEPEPAPEAIVAEIEPEPEPVAADAEPEPEMPPRPRVAPIRETILRIPRHPEPSVGPAADEPIAAQEDSPELAARRAQLDLLGLGDPGEGPVPPDRPAVIPYRSRGASPTPIELAARGAFWEASAREVAGAGATVGVQSCGQCGLSLSASARFCRRCGTRQAQSA